MNSTFLYVIMTILFFISFVSCVVSAYFLSDESKHKKMIWVIFLIACIVCLLAAVTIGFTITDLAHCLYL